MKFLITGGKGDIAKEIINAIPAVYYTPSSKELDVTDLESVLKYFKEYGPFDVVINNAGTIHPKRILESDEKLWVNDIMVNLVGPYYVTKHCLHQNPFAYIINIASTAAFTSYKDWSSYCASKAGLVSFTKSIAKDGFKIYGIAPGALLTDFRNSLNLSNDNALDPNSIIPFIVNIIDNQYLPGDIIFYRKGEYKII